MTKELHVNIVDSEIKSIRLEDRIKELEAWKAEAMSYLGEYRKDLGDKFLGEFIKPLYVPGYKSVLEEYIGKLDNFMKEQENDE